MGRTYRRIKNNRVNETIDISIVVVQHVYIRINTGIVQLRFQSVKVNALRAYNGIHLKTLDLQSTDFLTIESIDSGTDGVTHNREIPSPKIDVIYGNMRIIHQMTLCLIRMVLILVPIHKIQIRHHNLVDVDSNGAFGGIDSVGFECINKKSEIELLLAFVLNQIGFRVTQRHGL